jgi:hypothetical protein
VAAGSPGPARATFFGGASAGRGASSARRNMSAARPSGTVSGAASEAAGVVWLVADGVDRRVQATGLEFARFRLVSQAPRRARRLRIQRVGTWFHQGGEEVVAVFLVGVDGEGDLRQRCGQSGAACAGERGHVVSRSVMRLGGARPYCRAAVRGREAGRGAGSGRRGRRRGG